MYRRAYTSKMVVKKHLVTGPVMCIPFTIDTWSPVTIQNQNLHFHGVAFSEFQASVTCHMWSPHLPVSLSIFLAKQLPCGVGGCECDMIDLSCCPTWIVVVLTLTCFACCMTRLIELFLFEILGKKYVNYENLGKVWIIRVWQDKKIQWKIQQFQVHTNMSTRIKVFLTQMIKSQSPSSWKEKQSSFPSSNIN